MPPSAPESSSESASFLVSWRDAWRFFCGDPELIRPTKVCVSFLQLLLLRSWEMRTKSSRKLAVDFAETKGIGGPLRRDYNAA